MPPPSTAEPAASPTPPAPASIAPAELALLASVFVVAACGLVYELAAGALAARLIAISCEAEAMPAPSNSR